LKDKYLVICGNPEKRHGVVLAKNEKAKKAGIKTGDTLIEAKRKAKNLYALPPDFQKYSYLSKKAIALYKQYTSKVESFGLDECWLDVTDSVKLFGCGDKIADEIRNRMKSEIGLTVSVGVSFTKVFAKLGSDMKKPDAVTVIDKSNFKDKIWGLPIGELLYVGKSSVKKLESMGLFTIGDVAAAPRELLGITFGKNGFRLHEMANGIDDEEVSEANKTSLPESISNGSTTEKDITNKNEAESLMYSLSEVVAFRLRKYGLSALGISVGIRDNKLCYLSRQMKLINPTDDAKEIADYAMSLLEKHYAFGVDNPLRMITVGTYNLVEGEYGFQTTLFDEYNEKNDSLNDKLDGLRVKYGYGVLKRAIEINPDFTCDTHEIEDGYVPFDRHNGDDDK
jgi:DNA polymerase-4